MKTPEILNLYMKLYIFPSKFANVGMMWPLSTSDDFRTERKERTFMGYFLV
jgi:hypothetical protein